MSEATHAIRQPRRPLWLAALLGMLPPLAMALLLGMTLDALMWESGDPTGVDWLWKIVPMILDCSLAFASIAVLIAAIMAVAEQRAPQPPSVWLFAGIAATTPLILYIFWPRVPENPMGALIIYGFGMAAAAFTRHFRHGSRWE